MLMKILYKFASSLAKTATVPKSKEEYVSRFSGEWVRRNKNGVEDWEWKEKTRPIKPLYVNVFNLDEDYIIKVGYRRRGAAIKTQECRDNREAEIAVDVLKSYYEPLGNVFISDELE